MGDQTELEARSAGKCELCAAQNKLETYSVPNTPQGYNAGVLLCDRCLKQIECDELDTKHWRCLNESMWSTVPAVQVMAYRLLKRLESEPWAQDLLAMLYLEGDVLSWAEAAEPERGKVPTRDSNGVVLNAGDTVTVIKDLDVKGTSFVAKRGTAVRNISLCDNPEHIEGRVNGTRVVLLSCYLKKS